MDTSTVSTEKVRQNARRPAVMHAGPIGRHRSRHHAERSLWAAAGLWKDCRGQARWFVMALWREAIAAMFRASR